ncbi:MAG: 30S ribosomal protein S16 [Thermoleophilaceae bacterium]|nr:30S ribosomal protein S16 [Thermoleophilaceae bacterium]
MSVRVRLTRVGSKKNAIWRVVVADQRSPRDGRSIETIGHYNPQTQPSTVVLDRERLDHWLERGAVPSNTVKKLMRIQPDAPAAGVEAEEAPAPAEEAPAADAEADPSAGSEDDGDQA